jgi:FkbM family methyltransferase
MRGIGRTGSPVARRPAELVAGSPLRLVLVHPLMLKQLLKLAIPRPARARLRGAQYWMHRRMWEELSPGWQLESGVRVQVASPGEWIIYNEIFVDCEYDAAIQEARRRSRGRRLVALDLGANVGYFGLRLADRMLREDGETSDFLWVGIEGSPPTHASLVARAAQPALHGRAQLYLGLAGKRSGSALIGTSPEHGLNSVVAAQRSANAKAQVPFVDVESVLPPGERVSLLKCDIEGAEEMFLETYPELLRRIDVAVFELHPGLCDTARVVRLLAEAGLVRRHARVFSDTSVEMFSREG